MSDLKDPRVLFAAERTLLAWSRTALTLMAFGFAVERFSLFAAMISPELANAVMGYSSVIGILLLLLGSVVSVLSVMQYRKVVTTLNASEIPQGYWVSLSAVLNAALGILGGFLVLMLLLQRI